ncbi:MAG: DNA polymerase III subunit epsilon [Gammaproteobacteria bacterium RIFCSPHIGHO2_12_FULL_37_14]|nr:MAG: DNA polymerase III subunit epsilon [Gammaproteobacteria bacterium RIFCSPHIGHO2_12_FULL_37_14]
MRQIVLDTETTGIRVEDDHRIIEIGCLELVNRKLTGIQFHRYLNPEREIEAGAFAVHGISNEFLNDKPTFNVIVQEFIDFISGAELIIHNAPFDISFLNYELKLASRGFKKITDYCRVVDTLRLARQLHVGQRNNLDALCKRYGVDNSKREFHGALLDAYLLTQIYLIMTGGQGSFFDTPVEGANENSAEFSQPVGHLLHKYSLLVLQADATEVVEHEEYLQRMKQRGKCLWLDVSKN